MNITHVCSFPLHANPGGLDPCVGRHWIALPLTKTTIGLWKISEACVVNVTVTKDFALALTGHLREISAISLSNDRLKYLLSACNEKILLWDLLSENDGHISSQLFCTVSGVVSSLSMNNNNNIVAAGIGFKVFILKAGNIEPLFVLVAHRGVVTRLSFCPHYSATLVSLSDDHSFCVWDIQEAVLLFRSKVISPSPLISVSMNWTSPQVAIGTADGCLKVFDLTDGNDFRQLCNTNMALALRRQHELTARKSNSNMSARPDVNKISDKQSSVENPSIVELSESLLSVEYVYFAKECTSLNQTTSTSSGVNDILNERPPLICVITASAVIYINSRTFEILSIVSMQNPIHSQSFYPTKTVGLLAYAGLCQIGSAQIVAVVGTIFGRNIEVLNFELVKVQDQIESDKLEKSLEVEEDILSVIPVSTMLRTSPLMSEMLPPISSDSVTRGDVATGKKKLSSVMNQPLTFKCKIKSSGYSQTSVTTMFKPELNRSKLLNIPDHSKYKHEKGKANLGKMLKSEYDTSKGPPLHYYDSFEVDHQAGAVFNLRFTDDGSALGCALSNTCALSIKSPYNKHVSTCYVGHNKAVNSLFWSSSNDYLLTASNDKTALLWKKTGGDPILSLTHRNESVKEVHSSKIISSSKQKNIHSSTSCTKLSTSDCSGSRIEPSNSRDSKIFTKEIKHAQFFYLDKFILLTQGNELLLYNYYITPQRDEIKRYQSRNRYKLVANWQTSSCVFTATAAVNMFYSHLVMCTTSGRNLEVYDLNKSVLAHVFNECHTRPAHCVVINEGSCFASQQSEAYNVIATAAPTDSIKLWDLRAKSNIQSLQGHVNNSHACQIAFSPCGNYLVSGSENQMVYVFDLRKGTYIDCLKGHNEVVTSVAYHPGYQLFASGSLNGKILFYKSL